MTTQTVRLPIDDQADTLENRLNDTCDTFLASGLRLQAMTTVGDQLLLVFQAIG